MSNFSDGIFELGGLDAVRLQKVDRTLKDEFEDGSTSSRHLWSAQYFKRRFSCKTYPLTAMEFGYLESFYNYYGTTGSFTFRDNVNRGGNVTVRFATPLQFDCSASARVVTFDLEETAPTRLPGFREVAAVVGSTPLFMVDANRERYILSPDGSVGTPDANPFNPGEDLSAPGLAWQSGGLVLNSLIGGSAYQFDASRWAKTSSNIGINTAGMALFVIAKDPAAAAQKVIFAAGSMGANSAFGLSLAADNRYEPWVGGAETWSNARQNNSAASTFRSLAVLREDGGGGGTSTFYLIVNGASVGGDAQTGEGADYSTGPVSLGAAMDGTLKCSSSVAVALMFSSSLISGTKYKTLHNLFAPIYGLAQVSV